MSLRIVLAVLALLPALYAFADEASDAAKLTSEQRQGRVLFNESCVFCHGERGHATTLLGKQLGAANAMLERRTNLSPELVRHVVRHGINSMPFYRRAELSDHELELITAYLTRASAAK